MGFQTRVDKFVYFIPRLIQISENLFGKIVGGFFLVVGPRGFLLLSA